MQLGFSYWGFCEEHKDSSFVDTPDGGRFTRPLFVKELQRRGIDVVALQQQREINPLKGLKFANLFPKLDALFIEWRWPTYKNDITHKDFKPKKHEYDLDRQLHLIEYYHDKVPIVVWDTDLKVTGNDILDWPGITWTEPVIVTRKNFHSMLYFTDYDYNLFPPKQASNTYSYIGNNYERYWGVDKYYYNTELPGICINFWGNWLVKSPERPEQDEMIKKYSSKIKFHERIGFYEGMKILNNSLCTTHIVKKEYCDKGLITPRFFESLACNTPAFIIAEFLKPVYGEKYKVTEFSINEKVFAMYYANTIEGRRKIVQEQKNTIREMFPTTDVKVFVDILLKLF